MNRLTVLFSNNWDYHKEKYIYLQKSMQILTQNEFRLNSEFGTLRRFWCIAQGKEIDRLTPSIKEYLACLMMCPLSRGFAAGARHLSNLINQLPESMGSISLREFVDSSPIMIRDSFEIDAKWRLQRSRIYHILRVRFWRRYSTANVQSSLTVDWNPWILKRKNS